MVQWWVSVTFGLIAVAHFAAARLNLFLVVLLATLYTAFTGWVVMYHFYNMDILYGYQDDLAALGSEISRGSIQINQSNRVGIGTNFQDIAVPLMYLGSIAYLFYAYLTRNRSEEYK